MHTRKAALRNSEAVQGKYPPWDDELPEIKLQVSASKTYYVWGHDPDRSSWTGGADGHSSQRCAQTSHCASWRNSKNKMRISDPYQLSFHFARSASIARPCVVLILIPSFERPRRYGE
jgi:hypothetical protein